MLDGGSHLTLGGAVQIVEEDGTPLVHPADALPDTDASAGLLVTFILKQQTWVETKQRNNPVNFPSAASAQTNQHLQMIH